MRHAHWGTRSYNACTSTTTGVVLEAMLNLAQAQRPKDDESCPLGYTSFNVRTAPCAIDSYNLPIASTGTDAARLLVYTYINVCTSL